MGAPALRPDANREHRLRRPGRSGARADARARRVAARLPGARALPRRLRLGEPAGRPAERDAAEPPRGAARRADERAPTGPARRSAGGDRLMAGLLELRAVSKSFGGLYAIQELDL